MTSNDQPRGSDLPVEFDVAGALGRAEASGLALSEAIRPGVKANLELLAQHYSSVLSSLAIAGKAPS